jgi:hypothetical protein
MVMSLHVLLRRLPHSVERTCVWLTTRDAAVLAPHPQPPAMEQTIH